MTVLVAMHDRVSVSASAFPESGRVDAYLSQSFRFKGFKVMITVAVDREREFHANKREFHG